MPSGRQSLLILKGEIAAPEEVELDDIPTTIARFGLKAETLHQVSKESKVDLDLCYAMSAFLYTDARIETTVELLQAQGIRNLGRSSLYEKMWPAFRLVARSLQDK